MLRRILLTALIAGFLGGLFAAALQEWRVVPLILAAEVFEEQSGQDHAAAGHEHEAGQAAQAHEHDAGWQPEDGFERKAFTAAANVVTGIGFALLLTAAIALSGRRVDGRSGVLWGLAGFAVFTAAPSMGLPPELPGMIAADLHARQLWWACTAVGTAAGLAMLIFGPSVWWRLLALVLIVAPHAVGAPRPIAHGGAVPPELAAEFVIASLATAAGFWLVLGGLVGAAYQRLGREA